MNFLRRFFGLKSRDKLFLANIQNGPSQTASRNTETQRVDVPLTEAVKKVSYVSARILRVTKDGLTYVDDDGTTCDIDFLVCRENVEKELQSGGWLRIAESDDVYVGFRDSGARPPHITLASDPPTRFEFPTPKPPVVVNGFIQRPAEEYADFFFFQAQLMEVGLKTLDMA